MKNSKRGQIAIITLFALSAFVVIGSSVITQVIFEQRKAVLEQKSKEAYFAAEAGIEKGLQEILSNSALSTNLTVGGATVTLSEETQGSGATLVVPTDLFPGEHFYLNLQGYPSGGTLRICWDKPAASLIGIYFYTSGGNYLSNTIALNSAGSSNLTGGFASQPLTANVCGLSGSSYYYNLVLPSGTPDYLAIWVAYADAVQVGFASVLPATGLPAQGTTITSSALINEGENQVNRQVKYFVSQVAGDNLSYPPSYLLVPVYAVGGITF